MKCLSILVIIVLNVFRGAVTEKCQRRVCQHKIWAGTYTGLILEASYCTHVIIHCAEVTDQQELYLQIEKKSNEIQDIAALKNKNRNLKTILAVQNRDRYFEDFVKMYTTDNLKQKFINNVIKYVRANNIDGVKIDVQTKEGGDKMKLTQLLKDLLAAFTAEAARSKKQRLLLSVGVPSNKEFLDKYYDLPAITNFVDMVDLATYDLGIKGGKRVTNPTHHSPLYSKDPQNTKTIDYMARYVVEKGVQKDKINIGLSLMTVPYDGDSKSGRYFRVSWNQAYLMSCDVYTKDAKYYKLEPEKGRMVDWRFNKKYGFYGNRNFFDDPESLREKVKYVKANRYRGVLLYTVNDDDKFDRCKQGLFPLSKAIYDECSID